MPTAEDVSVIIPSRNEVFASQTANNVLDMARASTEVIVVLDGAWAEPVIGDRANLHVVHLSDAIGQRAATNLGARMSQAKYVMKLDAHCAVDEGFDVKLMEDCQPDWTMIPSQYSLHAFNWECAECGTLSYQGVIPATCKVCGCQRHEMRIVWQPRERRVTYSWRFDRNMQFQYWHKHSRRRENRGELLETMSCIGACMFLERERFWQLGGMDESHGSWGQFGTELACKAWLSGGKMMTTRRTWFAHMFRTGNFSAPGHSTFPYPLSQQQIDRAREYSRDLWLNDKWPLAVRPLSWLVDHFAPIPSWHEEPAPCPT